MGEGGLLSGGVDDLELTLRRELDGGSLVCHSGELEGRACGEVPGLAGEDGPLGTTAGTLLPDEGVVALDNPPDHVGRCLGGHSAERCLTEVRRS